MMAATADDSNRVLTFALRYISLGFSVVPVAQGKKQPGVTWEAWQKQRPTEQHVIGWFEGIFRNCGVGLVLGEISGNIFVTDVDVGPGKDGQDTIDALQMRYGDLPHTWESLTGSGGRHKFFRAPPGMKIKTGKNILGPGVDIRGEGGFVVAPPSTHPNGNLYRWVPGHTPSACDIADAPEWLLDLVKDDSPGLSPERKESHSTPHTHGASDGEVQTDAFGRVIDGRETYMRDLVWANAVEMARECPFKPTPQALCDIVWPVYERNVKRRGHDLEADGRGQRAMLEKCAYVVKRWDRVLAEAQATPPKDQPGGDGPGPSGKGADHGPGPSENTPPPGVRIIPATEFVAGFKPPVFLIDDVVQRSYVYSLTSPTGGGKTAVALLMAFSIATGRPFGPKAVEQGRVLFLAGENPDDVRARFILMCEAFKVTPEDVDIHFCADRVTLTSAADVVRREASAKGPFDLVIVDTAAAFFGGEDENSNAEMGAYARTLRSLVEIEGRPCILIPSHPVKNPSKDNLQPRGGGAFIAEVDGNLTLWSADQGDTTELHWGGKLRGPGFDPMPFKLEKRTSDTLRDAKGRHIPSVVAVAMSADDMAARQVETRSDEDLVLENLLMNPSDGMREACRRLGWMTVKGEQHSRLRNVIRRLEEDRLVRRYRGTWKLTEQGKSEAERLGGTRRR